MFQFFLVGNLEEVGRGLGVHPGPDQDRSGEEEE